MRTFLYQTGELAQAGREFHKYCLNIFSKGLKSDGEEQDREN